MLHRKCLASILCLALTCAAVARADNDSDLLAAVKAGNGPEIQRLVLAGANVNARDERGATPLFWAAVSGSQPVAEFLISNGAVVNARDREGFTALHAAAYQVRPEIARLLFAAGAEVNAISTEGWTPLHKALERIAIPQATGYRPPSDMAPEIALIELLLAEGADVNARVRQTTPLHFAAMSERKLLAELLIAKGAEVDAIGNEGVTPLYAAAKADRAEVVELLIARGGRVDARTASGYTALIWAAHTGNEDMVRLLIARGADVKARDNSKRSALIWALVTAMSTTRVGQLQLSRLSAAERAAFDKELNTMKRRWREVALILLEHGGDAGADSNNNSPLMMAANLGYRDVVAALISRGADMNDATTGETALHAAIAEQHRDVAELLIAKGADVNARNRSGRTPLHFLARDMDDRPLAQLMIERGADVNATDKYGETPLVFAKRSGRLQVADLLQRRAARPVAAASTPAVNPEARLTAVLDKTVWPGCRELLDLLRGEFPRMVVNLAGRNAQLDDGWRPGNPNWDAAHNVAVKTIAADELKSGPLFRTDPVSFARILARRNLTEQDVEFLTVFVDSAHGRNSITLLDLAMTVRLVDVLAEQADLSAEFRTSVAAVKARARESFPAVASRVAESGQAQPADNAQFASVFERLGPAQELGRLLGQEFFASPLNRVLQIFLFDSYSLIRKEIESYRASQTKI